MTDVLLIDSPFANVANIERALVASGGRVSRSADPNDVVHADRIVLPGVGAFPAAMRWLVERSLDSALRDAASRNAAILGICVGHQLLFESSDEFGSTRGLGLLRGSVKKFDSVRVPQIGWNALRFDGDDLFDGVANGTPFYFVNSYRVASCDSEIARGEYGGAFTAAARRGRIVGLQFHPEKSSTAGLRVLRNFVEKI